MDEIADNVYQAAYETERRKRKAAEKERDKFRKANDKNLEINREWRDGWKELKERRTAEIEKQYANKIKTLEAEVEEWRQRSNAKAKVIHRMERQLDHIVAVAEASDEDAGWDWPCVKGDPA